MSVRSTTFLPTADQQRRGQVGDRSFGSVAAISRQPVDHPTHVGNGDVSLQILLTKIVHTVQFREKEMVFRMVTTVPPAGPYAMSITPFSEDGQLDIGAWREHMQRLVSAGVGVYVASQQTGEGPLLSDAEHWQLLDIAADEHEGKEGRLHAANLERANAQSNVTFINEAANHGVDAVQLYPPVVRHSRIVPNDEELRQHYRDVFEHVDTPVFMSSNQSSGFTVDTAVYEWALTEYGDQIAGFNKYNADLNNVVDFLDRVGSKRPTYSGWMTTSFITFMQHGGAGNLDHGPNLIPRTYSAFFDAFRAGDTTTAMKHYDTITRLHFALRIVAPGPDTTPGSVKAAMRLLGLPGGYRRRPFIDNQPPADAVKKFMRVVDELGIREFESMN